MRTYVSPIGYDTRRVTQPVINTGVGERDRIILLRPEDDGDTERADQTITDVRQLLQKVEPNCSIRIDHLHVESLEETVRGCCRVLGEVDSERKRIVSLGGGARDLLLPLTVASLVYQPRIDRTLFYSDLDGSVHEWTLPDLTARIPDRTLDTFTALVNADGWLSLSELTATTDQSKSTVIRHVKTLDEAGIVDTEMDERTKRARVTFTGELLSLAHQTRTA